MKMKLGLKAPILLDDKIESSGSPAPKAGPMKDGKPQREGRIPNP